MRKLLVVLALALPLFAAIEKPAPPADLAKPPADAQRLENGLVMKKLADGKGTGKLQGDDFARLRYTVWKADGTLVQHVPNGSSLLIAQNKMLPGWAMAVKEMVPGEARRVWIPASLGAGKIKEGEMLVIDTELLDIIPYPKTPEDVAAPPADAIKTESGLAYKVLRPGTGTVHPKRSSTVVVHYSGWTTDGKMFDSSILRGQSIDFSLDGVIKGWTEGLQLMVEGERTRFWIPAHLAYGNEKGKPQGMLVFDVELMNVR
ncbi:MAG TPA: FKBP-type peptidyl-prolyl cis-trans isomerase [Thermoanaerobaculia bacterium]|nr:FKBP-type peptidyl-prolyl cis-trans isomerase [Thermoanaerobaculia bacterium]